MEHRLCKIDFREWDSGAFQSKRKNRLDDCCKQIKEFY